MFPESDIDRDIRHEEELMLTESTQARMCEHEQWYNEQVRRIEQRVRDWDEEVHDLIDNEWMTSDRRKKLVEESRHIGNFKRMLYRQLERDYVVYLKKRMKKCETSSDQQMLENELKKAEATVAHHQHNS